MPQLRKIWVAIRTRDQANADTDSTIALSINDKQITYNQTTRHDQERGRANLYEKDVAAMGISTEELNNSAIRVLILGSDLWAPQHLVVWGEEADGRLRPLAMETNINKILSTDPNEGNALLPLRLIDVPTAGVELTRLLFIVETNDFEDAGTDDAITLSVRNDSGAQLVDYTIPQGPGDLERAQANMYFVPVEIPFRRADVSVITLRTGGKDYWSPTKFFIFGLDGASNQRPGFLYPIVHIPRSNLGNLSTDPTEGNQSIRLPLTS
jgi:hypothetical protein